MAHRFQPSREPDLRSGQHDEPPWAAVDALDIRKASWGSQCLEFETVRAVSRPASVDRKQIEHMDQRPSMDAVDASTQLGGSPRIVEHLESPSLISSHDVLGRENSVRKSTSIMGQLPDVRADSGPSFLDVRSSSTWSDFTDPSRKSSRTSLQLDIPPEKSSALRDPSEMLQMPTHHKVGMDGIANAAEKARSAKWQEVRHLRDDIGGLRSQIREIRTSLWEKQLVKVAADDLLFRRMITQGMGSLSVEQSLPLSGQKTLTDLMDDCQQARDEYGPIEDDCNRLEELLCRQEFRLSQLEKPFFVSTEEPRPLAPTSRSLASPSPEPESHSEASNDEDFETPIYHPSVAKYLSKLGDLDLLHESLDDLFDEKESLERTKESRHRFGLHLNAEDQTWLDESQMEQDNLTLKIRLLDQELADLKHECLSLKLIDEDGEPTSLQDLEKMSFLDDEGVNPEDEESEYVKYPLLLPYSGLKRHRVKGYEPRPDETSDTTNKRINEWMLECLQMSPLDVNFLARCFEAWVGVGHVSGQWQYAVLNTWYRDGTLKGMPAVKRAHTLSSLTTQAPEVTDSTTNTARKPTSESNSLHFLLASAGLVSANISDATETAFIVGNSSTPRRKNFAWNSD